MVKVVFRRGNIGGNGKALSIWILLISIRLGPSDLAWDQKVTCLSDLGYISIKKEINVEPAKTAEPML